MNEKTINKDQIVNRLRRIEGQIRGINKMIDEEKGCVEIITQIAAAKAALSKTGLLVIQKYCKQCLEDGTCSDNVDQIIERIMMIFDRSKDL